MPSTYAHYRFGFRAISKLPPQAAALIRRNRQMFDLGLHGPDFLFYYNPLHKNRYGRLGSEIHEMTGAHFFTRSARMLKLQPSEAGEAYLYGVLAHFALDSKCHPFVNEMAGKDAGHVEMEVEFDRHLLELEGRENPYSQILTRHIQLEKKEDAAQIARFYPGISAPVVKTCLFNMNWMGRFLAAPKGVRREIIGRGMLGNTVNENMMMPTANPRCAQLTPRLMEQYTQAEAAYPALVGQLWNHIHNGGKLGAEFDAIFG